MAENKKISELDQIQSLSNDDEFMVVDKSTTSGEDASSSGKTTRVTLNQLKEAVSASGAKGERGAQGAQGARGATGSAGSNGSNGSTGAQGAQGATGPQGQKGQAGSNGSTGSRGDQGAQGAQGPKGDQGSQGATGPKGDQGARGATGSAGSNGSTGAKGQKGQAGSTGATGAKGSVGASIRGATGLKGAPGVGAKGQKGQGGSGGQKGQKGLTGVGQKGASGASGVFAGGTVTAPIKVSSTADEKLVLEGSGHPYIRFREATTNKAYIQWHSSDESLFLMNSQDNVQLRLKKNMGANVVTSGGSMWMGCLNTGHAHFYTDRSNFYFNKQLQVHGSIIDYASKATYYHSGNLSAVTRLPDGSSPDYTAASSRRVNPTTKNPTNSYYAISTFGNGGNVTGQLATQYVSGEAYTRGFNSKWSAWRRQLDTTNMKSINGHFARMYTGSSTNNAYFRGTTWGTTHQTNHGYILFGPANTSHAHIYTDRANFYFNKELLVNAHTVYHSGNSSKLAKTNVDSYFDKYKLRVRESLLVYNSKGVQYGQFSNDSNGFTRIYGQYGVGICGSGVTSAGSADLDELGRFTAMSGDLKGSSLLNVGKTRDFARIDICNGSSIFQQKNTHGDNLYISCLARYRHKPKGEWFMTEKGHACVLAVARNGLHMHSTNTVHNKGATVTAYSHDMMMNQNGSMYVRGGYYKLSDRRDKKNIVSIDKTEVMEKLLKLRPVTFEWKDRPGDTGVKQGLIAQEVEKVIPEIVSIMESPNMPGVKNKSDRKTVDYEELVPLLISAVQTQQQQINDLKRQLNSK